MLLPQVGSRSVDLLGTAASALRIPWAPLSWPVSILGTGSQAVDAPAGFTGELKALFGRSWSGTVSGALRATVSVPFGQFVLPGDSAPDRRVPDAQFPHERWMFINGICTDHPLARTNTAELQRFSGRRVQLLYNNTQGVLADLFESAVGKTYSRVTEAVLPNFAPVVDALCDATVKRIVLVSHSQGTIVTAVMLKILHEVLAPGFVAAPHAVGGPSGERLLARQLANHKMPHALDWLLHKGRDWELFNRALNHLKANTAAADISKLELYCFANCATSMSPFTTPAGLRGPWIESYGNEFDIVARLGVLAAPHGGGSARIEGDSYFAPKTWGHFLNAHYLAPMYSAMNTPGLWQPFPRNIRTTPRLWEYANGQRAPRAIRLQA